MEMELETEIESKKRIKEKTEEKIKEIIGSISGLNQKAAREAGEHWDKIAKPLNSLGWLEDAVVKIAGITGNPFIDIGKKAVVVFCADNGIVEEGVTQTGQEVTAVVAENFARGESCVCIMAERAGAFVLPVDIGIKHPLSAYGTGKYPVRNCRLMPGTRNFIREPAIKRETVLKAIETGIELVRELKEDGYRILATGEMGIGNTTTSSAVLSVLLNVKPEQVTGRGAGLSDAGLQKKLSVIRQGISLWKPDRRDAVDVLSKVGGLDLAGLTGVFLGGAIYRIPVIIDGLISGAAALIAAALSPAAKDFMLASHLSAEPAGKMVLQVLGLEPIIYGNLCLGEGTGAVALFPLLDMAAAVYGQMSTFSQIKIKEYEHLS